MKSPTVALALLATLLACACRATAANNVATAVAFTTLAEGSGGDLETGPQGVIRTASGFERLWANLPDAGSPPQVDFSREMVLFASGAEVERVVAQGGFLRVELAARAGRYHVVRLARSDAPVQFEASR